MPRPKPATKRKLPAVTYGPRIPAPPPVPENSIFTIRPYRWHSQWVFDDPERGLVREPFVGGTDDIVTEAVAKFGLANAMMPGVGFVAIFSAQPFPGAMVTLEWVRPWHDGNIYRWKETGMEGYQCPALLRYFRTPPKAIYVQVKAVPGVGQDVPAPDGGDEMVPEPKRRPLPPLPPGYHLVEGDR